MMWQLPSLCLCPGMLLWKEVPALQSCFGRYCTPKLCSLGPGSCLWASLSQQEDLGAGGSSHGFKRDLEVASLLLCTCVVEKFLSQLCSQWDKLINKLINEVLPPEQRGGRDFDPSPWPGLSQMSPGSVAGAFWSQEVLETAGFLLEKGAVAAQGWGSTWRLPPIVLGILRRQ